MAAYVLALDRLESAGAHVQCELAACNAAAVTLGKHLAGEVQAGRGGSHAAVDVAVHRLVVGGIALLGLAVQVGRNGYLAYGIEQRGKGHLVAIPGKGNFPRVAATLAARGRECELAAVDLDHLRERTLLPALAVAHQAQPGAGTGGLEYLLVVARQHWLEAEDFDRGAGVLAETQAGVDDARVVVDEHRALWQQCRHLVEAVLAHALRGRKLQQLALLPLVQGVLGDALVGQGIVVVGYLQILYFLFQCHNSNKNNKYWRHAGAAINCRSPCAWPLAACGLCRNKSPAPCCPPCARR